MYQFTIANPADMLSVGPGNTSSFPSELYPQSLMPKECRKKYKFLEEMELGRALWLRWKCHEYIMSLYRNKGEGYLGDVRVYVRLMLIYS